MNYEEIKCLGCPEIIINEGGVYRCSSCQKEREAKRVRYRAASLSGILASQAEGFTHKEEVIPLEAAHLGDAILDIPPTEKEPK